MRPLRPFVLAGVTACTLACTGIVHADPPPAPRETVTAPPAVPLDSRIDAAAVTSTTLPPLPRTVVQPLPAIRRIAATPQEVPTSEESYRKARQAIEAGLAYLRTTQRPSGAWMERDVVQPTDAPRLASASVAVTALGAKAFLQATPATSNDSAALRSLDFVVRAVRREGYEGFAASGIGTYVTSAVLSALATSKDDRFTDEIRGAIDWLKTNQWDQSEGVAPEQDWFGGAGYGRGRRPDLSNTQMMLDALHDAGVSPDDPAVQRALAFVSRAQNLPETNAAAWATSGSGDGGFVYSPANGGESFASELAGEGRKGELLPADRPRSLRSYGSMTYAGFKSLLYAGLSRDDPRVKAAYDWIRRHYTFDENPGLGADGLFYYYHAMARALLASQQHRIEAVPPGGEVVERNWRDDLIAALVARQRADGSWVNTSDRWEESQADLVTIYAVLALEEAIKPVLAAE